MRNPDNTPAPAWTDESWKARHVANIAQTIPQAYDDLAPELIAEHMYARGVRKLILNIDDGGPTYGLRLLIDELRSGLANADDLDNALNILEVRLNIPLTTADDLPLPTATDV